MVVDVGYELEDMSQVVGSRHNEATSHATLLQRDEALGSVREDPLGQPSIKAHHDGINSGFSIFLCLYSFSLFLPFYVIREKKRFFLLTCSAYNVLFDADRAS